MTNTESTLLTSVSYIHTLLYRWHKSCSQRLRAVGAGHNSAKKKFGVGLRCALDGALSCWKIKLSPATWLIAGNICWDSRTCRTYSYFNFTPDSTKNSSPFLHAERHCDRLGDWCCVLFLVPVSICLVHNRSFCEQRMVQLGKGKFQCVSVSFGKQQHLSQTWTVWIHPPIGLGRITKSSLTLMGRVPCPKICIFNLWQKWEDPILQ